MPSTGAPGQVSHRGEELRCYLSVSAKARYGPRARRKAIFIADGLCVVLSFPALPAGTYALAISACHGAYRVQQISLVLSKSVDGRWLLGRLDCEARGQRETTMACGTGCRRVNTHRQRWTGCVVFLSPGHRPSRSADFLSSPNLEKRSMRPIRFGPTDLPGKAAMTFYAQSRADSSDCD